MKIMANGQTQWMREGATVADLVTELGHHPNRPGVAVAVNGVVVPRTTWQARVLADGDSVEVLGAVQGG